VERAGEGVLGLDGQSLTRATGNEDVRAHTDEIDLALDLHCDLVDKTPCAVRHLAIRNGCIDIIDMVQDD
jgi:hypothetical protein